MPKDENEEKIGQESVNFMPSNNLIGFFAIPRRCFLNSNPTLVALMGSPMVMGPPPANRMSPSHIQGAVLSLSRDALHSGSRFISRAPAGSNIRG